MALPALVSLFRPRTFFHFISLLTATEFITVSLLINKVEGVYGILALFTGFPLSAFQLSMYIYSIVIFGLVCYLGPHIRKQSPLQNLVLAWIYILDSAINALYTALFGLGYFLTLADHLNPSPTEDGGSPAASVPGGKTINDTAGFTDPQAGPVDGVDVITEPRPDKAGEEAKIIPHGDGSGLGTSVFQSGSIMSITIISTLWFIRLYFVLIVMAYARQVLRGYSQTAAAAANRKPVSADDTDSTSNGHLMADSNKLANPFHYASPLGQGWQGKLGRFLTKFPATYWLGRDEADEEWVRGADERFRRRMASRGPVLKNPPAPSKGTGERERRARSGTGPPPVGMELLGRRSGESVVEARPSGDL